MVTVIIVIFFTHSRRFFYWDWTIECFKKKLHTEYAFLYFARHYERDINLMYLAHELSKLHLPFHDSSDSSLTFIFMSLPVSASQFLLFLFKTATSFQYFLFQSLCSLSFLLLFTLLGGIRCICTLLLYILIDIPFLILCIHSSSSNTKQITRKLERSYTLHITYIPNIIPIYITPHVYII